MGIQLYFDLELANPTVPIATCDNSACCCPAGQDTVIIFDSSTPPTGVVAKFYVACSPHCAAVLKDLYGRRVNGPDVTWAHARFDDYVRAMASNAGIEINRSSREIPPISDSVRNFLFDIHQLTEPTDAATVLAMATKHGVTERDLVIAAVAYGMASEVLPDKDVRAPLRAITPTDVTLLGIHMGLS